MAENDQTIRCLLHIGLSPPTFLPRSTWCEGVRQGRISEWAWTTRPQLIEATLAVDQHTQGLVHGIVRQAVLFIHIIDRQTTSPKILCILTSCRPIPVLHQL